MSSVRSFLFALLLVWLVCDRPATAADAVDADGGAAPPNTADSVYGEGVRPTPWQSPHDEQRGFHLPEGFEIRLFASEPQIAKPLNMAWDGRGRLWVTQSVAYPYPVATDAAGPDAVMVLEDTDDDGAADRFTTFADGLNLPMGVLPYGDGCLCFSIPNLVYLRDTDGDGRCDRRETVLGPFDTTRDTHGMVNSLRDGGDGWIYACHGFNNQSTVAGRDGHTVTMHSGNTFRFRPDGSRVEHVSHGQVNPFGMTRDQWGYWYTADCHSKPITQIIRGGCYPSFGRPHDGLGFLPPTVDHLHGSTAISGIVYLPPDSPIEPLRGQFISGNVMTSRLNRNRLQFQGATARGQEMSDFLTSDDPWFRPVDIQLGDDGHLYVADFYNKIIGHYEVPLDHPQRDRRSGRIWQIRYRHPQPSSAAATPTAVVDVDATDLFNGELSPPQQVAAWRLAAESQQPEIFLSVARHSLDRQHPHIARAAAEFLGRHGGADDDVAGDVQALLARLDSVADGDPVLRQTIRIAVRDLLRTLPAGDPLWSGPPSIALASILVGLDRSEAAATLLLYLNDNPAAADGDVYLSHAAKHADGESIAACVEVARRMTADDVPRQYELLDLLCQSQNARPGNVAAPLRRWALDLIQHDFQQLLDSPPSIVWGTSAGDTWPVETRAVASGATVMLTSSFGRGESYTGVLSSDSFAAPQRITFWIAGHNGFPNQPDTRSNLVRLVAADSGDVLQQAYPPRSDVAQSVHWDTASLDGREVRIECVDQDAGNAYAWIAVGQWQPQWIEASQQQRQLSDPLLRITRLGLEEKRPDLQTLVSHPTLSLRMQVQAAGALATLDHNPAATVMLDFLQRSGAPREQLQQAIAATVAHDPDAIAAVTKTLCQRMSSTMQREFVLAWSRGGADPGQLLKMCQQGWIAAAVFADPEVQQTVAVQWSDEQAKQIAKLTATVDIGAEQTARLHRLQQSFGSLQFDPSQGGPLFTKHCAACHQLRGQGAVVGPQLDGAVTRSVARLLEDIVTPDQNIDAAFRTSSFLLDDGRVLVGLVTSDTPTQITLVESNGKPVSIDPAAVEQRREAGRSLMPGNLAELMSDQQLAALIEFVRGQ